MADLVSVVIPVYNTNERFKACFESVLNQKYENIEIIIIDDGSVDSSAQICDLVTLLTSVFPVFVIHKLNGGVSRARNLGIDFVNGKYVVFIDSDDIVTPNYISDFMASSEKYPYVGHVWCGIEWSSHHKKCIYSDTESISFVDRNDYYDLAKKMLTQSPCLRIYDVSVLRNNKIRMIETLSLGEDLIFNLEYLDAVPETKICVINSANYIYLDSDTDSLNNKYREDLKEVNMLILDKISEYTAKWGIADPESAALYNSSVYYKSVQIMQNTFHKKNKASYFQKVKYNNEILRSKAFIDSLSLMNARIPNHLRRVYQTKNYFCVRVYDRIVKIYGFLRRHLFTVF